MIFGKTDTFIIFPKLGNIIFRMVKKRAQLLIRQSLSVNPEMIIPDGMVYGAVLFDFGFWGFNEGETTDWPCKIKLWR